MFLCSVNLLGPICGTIEFANFAAFRRTSPVPFCGVQSVSYRYEEPELNMLGVAPLQCLSASCPSGDIKTFPDDSVV